MSITLSFKVTKERNFVLVSSSTPAKDGAAEAMKKIFEVKKVFDRKTTQGVSPSWDEFTAKITANHETNFHLQLTSQKNVFIYNLNMMTPKTAETLVSPEELEKLRNPSATPAPKESVSVPAPSVITNERVKAPTITPSVAQKAATVSQPPKKVVSVITNEPVKAPAILTTPAAVQKAVASQPPKKAIVDTAPKTLMPASKPRENPFSRFLASLFQGDPNEKTADKPSFLPDMVIPRVSSPRRK